MAEEFAVAVEYLDTSVATVGYVDISLRVGSDAVRRVELAGLVAGFAKGLEPFAAFVDLCYTRIDITVADVCVAGWVPRDVGNLAELSVNGRQRRMHMFEWAGALVRGLLLAPEHHDDLACGIELDHHVRPYVGDPDVVLFVDSDSVRVGPCVQIVSNLAKVRAVGAKFQELGGARTIRWPRRVATREYDDVSLGIDRHAGRFTEIYVRRKL